MSLYRPTQISGGGVRGDVTPFSGSNELSHAGLSAGAEASLTGSPADIGKAHNFFAAAGAEAHAVGNAALAPAAQAGLMHMPLVPGASEPISPLIQLIMRMPGQIGLFSSFFEALGNFFLPHLHALGLDPSILDMHAHVASMSSMHMPGMEHAALDHASLGHAALGHVLIQHLLPANAPFFHSDMSGMTGGMSSANGMVMHSDILNPRGILKVSGGLGDLSKAQFEAAPSGLGSNQPSELLSGPSISDTPLSTHLAGTQRLFDDRIQGTFFAKQGMQAAMSAGPSPIPQGLSTTSGTLPSNLNVGASTLGAQPSAPPVMANDGGAATSAIPQSSGMESGSLGPSGAINHLGDTRQLIAANPGGEAFRPSLGAQGSDYGQSYLNAQPVDITPHAAAPHVDHAAGLKPLHAKELSLDSVDGAGHHQVMDHIGHQSKAGAGFNHVSNAQDQISHRNLHQAYQTGSSHAAGHSSSVPTSHVKIASAPTPHPVQSSHPVSPSESHAHAAADHSQAGADKTADSASDKAGDQGADDKAANANDQTDGTDATSDYTIKSGDNLWNIAKDHLGSGLKWHQIYDMNKDLIGQNPDLIFSGTKLKLPGTDLASAGADSAKYVVKSGDNLWNIAKDQMHDATKWGDLFKANQDIIGSNPRLIMPGQELTLPGHESATTVADGSGASGANDASATDATSATEPAAQSAANVPQTAAPSGPSSSFGSPATTDGAAAAPTSAPEAAPAMEAQPQVQPMQAPAAQPVAPHLPAGIPGAAMAPAASPFGGAAAGAATLHVMPLAQPQLEATAASAHPSVVNSSIGTDLATFLSQKK